MQSEDGDVGREGLRREHVLRRPLEDALAAVDTTDPAALAETVLATLDAHRVIAYAPRETLAILTPAGRTLVLVTERPTATLREIALMLGVSESNVAKSVGLLARANVITRTKVGGRNSYTLNAAVAAAHPDLRRYHDAVGRLLADADLEPPASTPGTYNT